MENHALRAAPGNALVTINRLMQQVRAQHDVAYQQMVRLGRAAASALSKAGQAKRRGDQLAAQSYARDAYNARIKAEGAKYAAVYFAAAEDAYAGALGDMKHAASLSSPTGRVMRADIFSSLTDRASLKTQRAEAFVRAVDILQRKVREMPEPFVASKRALDAFVTSAGGRSREVSVDFPQLIDRSKVSPLMASFFPDEVVQAAGALSGLGNVSQDSHVWWEEVKKALGTGAAAAGAAAKESGTEVSKGNPVIGAAFAATGGLLEDLSKKLNVTLGLDARQPSAEVQSEIPWALIGGTLVGGYLLWKVLK